MMLSMTKSEDNTIVLSVYWVVSA